VTDGNSENLPIMGHILTNHGVYSKEENGTTVAGDRSGLEAHASWLAAEADRPVSEACPQSRQLEMERNDMCAR